MACRSEAGHFSSFILFFSPPQTHQSFLTRNLSPMTSFKDIYFLKLHSCLWWTEDSALLAPRLKTSQTSWYPLVSINASKVYNHNINILRTRTYKSQRCCLSDQNRNIFDTFFLFLSSALFHETTHGKEGITRAVKWGFTTLSTGSLIQSAANASISEIRELHFCTMVLLKKLFMEIL